MNEACTQSLQPYRRVFHGTRAVTVLALVGPDVTRTMSDLQMEDVAHENDISKGPSFSDEEKEILDLYDQVQKLELEVALAKARVRLAGEFSEDQPCRPTSHR